MNARQIKLLALGSMVFDHVTRVLPLTVLLLPLSDRLWAMGWEGSAMWVLDGLPHILQYFGRLAAPLFLFGIAEGYRHTRDVRRYLGRLLLTAAVAQGPYVCFALAENRLWGIPGDWRTVDGSILFTMALGLAALAACEGLRRRGRPILGALAALAVAVAAYFLPIEGGKGYILLLFVLYYTRDLPRWQRALVFLPAAALSRLGLVRWLLAEPTAGVVRTVCLNVVGNYLGMLLTLCHNGRQGRTSPAFRRFFYVFYPAHFALLSILSLLLPPFVA